MAAIFDLDGTLVDLLHTHYEGFRHVMKEELNLDFDIDELRKWYGKSGEEIIRQFLQKNNLDLDAGRVHELACKRRTWVLENLREVEVLPGAKRLLEGLKKRRVKLGLGTSNTENIGKRIVEVSGLGGFLDAQVYRTEDMDGKPAPDIFLKAAEMLGEKPSQCIVFEDSVYGIMAAKAAGMKTVAVATGTTAKEKLNDLDPDIVVGSLKEVNADDVMALLEV